MDLDEKRRMMKGWRGRRLLACRTLDDVHEIIAALAQDDGGDLPPDGGLPTPPNEAMIAEMQNIATTLKRLILLHNDGHVSPARLQRFQPPHHI